MAGASLHWNMARVPEPTSSQDEYSALTDVPIFLGYIFSFLLQGILVVQVFIYFVSFSSTDPRYVKITVALVFFIDCLSSFFATFVAIWGIVSSGYLVTGTFLWGFKAVAALCGIVTLLVQGFYSWRIRLLNGHWIIPVIIMLLSIIQCVAVMYSGFKSLLGVGLPIDISPVLLSMNFLWLLGSASCDFTISITLLVLLRRATARLKTPKAKSALGRVMVIAIETGMITAFGACIELVFYLTLRNSFIHFILFYTLPKLYSNCMMATLNARLATPERRFRESAVEWLTPNSAGELQTGTLLSSLESGEVLDIKRTSEISTVGEVAVHLDATQHHQSYSLHYPRVGSENSPDPLKSGEVLETRRTSESSAVSEVAVHLHATKHHRLYSLQYPHVGSENPPELPSQMAGHRRMTVTLPLRKPESALEPMAL